MKAHAGIEGNERAGEEAKRAASRRGADAVPESGVRSAVAYTRRKERVVKGFGVGRIMKWKERHAVTAYSQPRSGKGRLGVWPRTTGRRDYDRLRCSRCPVSETKVHAALGCIAGEE